MFGRDRSSNNGHNGYAVWSNGMYQATNAITTLPVWFRLKIGLWTGYNSDRVVAEYSTNGTDWTALFSGFIDHSAPGYGTVGVGLFAENYVGEEGLNAIAAPFEYFRMYRDFGPYI